MVEKLKTLVWFAKRPKFWAHAVVLVIRKAKTNYDAPEIRTSAREWAKQRAVSLIEVLELLGIEHECDNLEGIPDEIIAEANSLAKKSRVKMGGAGAIDLLYGLTKLLKPSCIVETGVAYGWSSMAFLSATYNSPNSRLISVDMPYPKMNNEPWVGVVVSDKFHKQWTLIREPDRYGLTRALRFGGSLIDICHYDSDKSYWGRKWAYPKLWESLRSGGVFISDDIQDNYAFKEFVEEKDTAFCVMESQGKYVGISRKD